MRSSVLAAVLLLLAIGATAFISNLQKASVANGESTGRLAADATNVSNCVTENSKGGSCVNGVPAGITYATNDLNWKQTISTPLTGGSRATVTLAPCPAGVDTVSGAGYQVYLSGSGNSEAVNVVSAAGGCTSGASSGTITITPIYSYPAGYTISSASSGIQEALNIGCGVNATLYKNSQCNVTIPANGPFNSINTYNIFGTIYLHSNQSVLSGYGTSLNCVGRGACLQVGDLHSTNDFTDNTISGLSFRSPINLSSSPEFAGVKVTQTQRTSQVVTITTARPHGFRVGDMVTILFTDSSGYWGDARVTAVPSSTSFQYAHPGADIAAQVSPGVVALAYVAVLDNAMNTHFIDISYDKVGENGHFNNFFDIWDDENVTIDHFNNQALSLNDSENWTGSYIFSAGNQSMQVAPVITLRDSTITANCSNGITDYNSNGLYIENTVLQATGLWQVYSSNSTGNYQGAYLKNIYSESSVNANPVTPPRSPFPGLGFAGLIAGRSSGAADFQIAGNGGTDGGTAGGSTSGGTVQYYYFIVARDGRMQTSPMLAWSWKSTGKDSIQVRWPRVANGADAITYDVIRIGVTAPITAGFTLPSPANCSGASTTACGSVATGITQVEACGNGLTCTYADKGSAITSAYTVKQGNYDGNILFWPGSIVSVGRTVHTNKDYGGAVGIGLNGNPLEIADRCSNFGQTSTGGYTVCLASGNSAANQTGFIVTDGASNTGRAPNISKGKLLFETTPDTPIGAHHILTLIDSQPGLTQATIGFRPPASGNDTWIGTDVPNGTTPALGQLAFGSPVSITNYIGQTGDGIHTNWLERLTSKEKTFAVPLIVKEGNSFTLGDGSPLSQMKIYKINNIKGNRVAPQSCVDVIGQAKGITKADAITNITPPGRLGNVSLNAYPGDEGLITLHFCNPSTSEVTTPSGWYSFLAVH
jgi:hypothetical protein